LEYVEIFCTTGGTNVAGTLKIYSGSTVTSTPIHTQAQPATAVNAGEFLRIYLTGPVVATSFSQLTFELPMSLTIPYSGGNPYPGGRLFYDGTNAALYANSDIRFNVSITSDCTPTTAAISASACGSYLSPSGELWTSSGQYTDTVPNVQGCDSIITVELEVIDLDATITLDGAVLEANATGVEYQWLDCDNGDAPIEGATQQNYAPETPGNYAVLISASGCNEQSACVFVGSTGMADEHRSGGFLLAPNPSTASFRIDARTPTVLRITNALGQQIVQQRINAGPNIIEHGLPAGSYLVWMEGVAVRLAVR
jgi:hypothetical protein